MSADVLPLDAWLAQAHELPLTEVEVEGRVHRAAPRRPLEQVLDMVRQAWTSIERSEAAS